MYTTSLSSLGLVTKWGSALFEAMARPSSDSGVPFRGSQETTGPQVESQIVEMIIELGCSTERRKRHDASEPGTAI